MRLRIRRSKDRQPARFQLNKVIYPSSVSGVRTSSNSFKDSRRFPLKFLHRKKTTKKVSITPIQENLKKSWAKRPVRLLMLCLILWFCFTPLFNVTCQTRSGSSACVFNDYQMQIGSSWPWWRRNILLNGWSELKRNLFDDNPYIAGISINRQITGVVRFSVTERVRAAILETHSNDGAISRYFIAEDGVVLEVMNTNITQVVLPIIKDMAQLDIRVGEGIIDPTTIDYTKSLGSENINGYIIDTVTIDSQPRQMTVNLVDASNRTLNVLMNTARPLEEQLLDLRIVTTYLIEKGTYPIYIDIRLASVTPYKIQ